MHVVLRLLDFDGLLPLVVSGLLLWTLYRSLHRKPVVWQQSFVKVFSWYGVVIEAMILLLTFKDNSASYGRSFAEIIVVMYVIKIVLYVLLGLANTTSRLFELRFVVYVWPVVYLFESVLQLQAVVTIVVAVLVSLITVWLGWQVKKARRENENG